MTKPWRKKLLVLPRQQNRVSLANFTHGRHFRADTSEQQLLTAAFGMLTDLELDKYNGWVE